MLYRPIKLVRLSTIIAQEDRTNFRFTLSVSLQIALKYLIYKMENLLKISNFLQD